MKLYYKLLNQIKQDYALNTRLSVPYLQRKWKFSDKMAAEVVKYLTVGMVK